MIIVWIFAVIGFLFCLGLLKILFTDWDKDKGCLTESDLYRKHKK